MMTEGATIERVLIAAVGYIFRSRITKPGIDCVVVDRYVSLSVSESVSYL
jgi:hypothetical protein